MPRYIDVDALIERLGINQDCTECSYCTRTYFCSWNPDPGEICIAISEQPVVTINDHPEEIKVTNCNYNQFADASKKGDMISREDALNCFHDWIGQRGDVHTADEMPEYQRIEQLPSAQPEIHFDEWCTDCNEYDHEKHCCPRFNKVIRGTVEEVKEAQPKIGKWIYDGDCYICNKCGTAYSWWADSQTSNYCPNCGCRMLKEGE